MEEVFIEVHVPAGTSAKEVKCRLGSRDIELQVRGKEIFQVRSEVFVSESNYLLQLYYTDKFRTILIHIWD